MKTNKPPHNNISTINTDNPQKQTLILRRKSSINFLCGGKLLYILAGVAGSLGFTVLLYYFLSLDSSIDSLIEETKNSPLYLSLYSFFTIGSIVLFGVNVSLLTYKIKSAGKAKIKKQFSSGFGSIFGIAASACPACGSTLLSAIGIAGGLSSLPFQGLELKFLSFFLMAAPVILIANEIDRGNKLNNRFENHPEKEKGAELTLKEECADCVSSSETSKNEFNRRDKNLALIFIILILVFGKIGFSIAKYDPVFPKIFNAVASIFGLELSEGNKGNSDELTNKITNKVIPKKGFKTKIKLEQAIFKMANEGIIDKEKFIELYESRGGIPEELKKSFNEPLNKPVVLNHENAGVYLNFLWPLGISNYMEANKESPLNGESLFNFASTGGWTLGKEENGGAYFNKSKIIEITPEQEKLAVSVAQNIYRPCCGNSAFFQDCNHGSAILGLLELGASQGLSEKELYEEALAFNSFWFPDTYVKLGIYFKKVKNTDWEDIDPKIILSKDYSSARGFKNINKILQDLNLLPQIKSQAGCGA